jgi:hypothetical protein
MGHPEERIALIEVIGRDGRVARAVDVFDWPVTLGRALDNHVVLDDPHVAAHHAVIGPGSDGLPQVTALQTRNGVQIGQRRLASGSAAPVSGAPMFIGGLRVRMRIAGEVLAEEQLLTGAGRGQVLLRVACLLGLVALVCGGHWLELDPGADYSAWLTVLVGMPLMLAGWCSAWALMSKVFQNRFDFAGHLYIALPWILAIYLIDAVWPQAMASFGLPQAWPLSQPLLLLLIALLVRAHLRHALPLHPRGVDMTVAFVALAGTATMSALTWRATDSLRGFPYMSTLPVPALRFAQTVPSATLVEAMGPIAEQLAQRVKKARDEGEDEVAETQ